MVIREKNQALTGMRASSAQSVAISRALAARAIDWDTRATIARGTGRDDISFESEPNRRSTCGTPMRIPSVAPKDRTKPPSTDDNGEDARPTLAATASAFSAGPRWSIMRPPRYTHAAVTARATDAPPLAR